MSTCHFEQSTQFPDPDAKDQYEALMGLDDVKHRLETEAAMLVNPSALDEWSQKHHKTLLPAIELVKRRPPLIIFAGDVGTGKTALATSFGDPVARKLKIPVFLQVLSLKARGSGAVGEMTKLITEALQAVKAEALKGRRANGKPTAATILLIDEADALAQSRETSQMHHEDRAGVNALIRGIDDIASARIPCLIVMCTNRLGAIDPAVQRRAAAIFEFERPDPARLTDLLNTYLEGAHLTSHCIADLVKRMSPTSDRPYGYTFSDVTQRFIPSLLLAAFPDQPITPELARRVAAEVKPTKPFQERPT